MFTKNGTKANIDEIELSNQNNNKIEEKFDNKKKCLISTGIALGTVALGAAGILLKKKFLLLQINVLIY